MDSKSARYSISARPATAWWPVWRRSLSDLLVPAACIACEVALEPDATLQICVDCRESMCGLEEHGLCEGCGARIRLPGETVLRCHLCRDLKLPFASVTCLGNYESLLRDLVIRMKRQGGQAIALQLGRWLASELANHPRRFDLITPMPIYWLRRLRRGHNVASLLAESIGATGVSTAGCGRSLVVARRTRKQGTLTTAQRFQNVKDCFDISRQADIGSKSILLVDDVMTSCATALQAAKALQRGGAGEIHLAIVARGVGH